MARALLIKSCRKSGSHQAAVSRLYEHLWRLQHDTRGPGDLTAARIIFTQDGEVISRERAMENILHQPAAKVRYHQMIFAFSDLRPLDACALTQTLIDQVAGRLGLALYWVAGVHRNREPVHAHVILAGAGASADGKPQSIAVDREDWTWLRHGLHVPDPHVQDNSRRTWTAQTPRSALSIQSVRLFQGAQV